MARGGVASSPIKGAAGPGALSRCSPRAEREAPVPPPPRRPPRAQVRPGRPRCPPAVRVSGRAGRGEASRGAAARAGVGRGDTWQRSAAPRLPRGEGPLSRRSVPAGVPGPYVTGAGGLRRGAGGRRRAGFPAAGRLNTAAASFSFSSFCCASSRSRCLQLGVVPGRARVPVRPRELRALGSALGGGKVTRRKGLHRGERGLRLSSPLLCVGFCVCLRSKLCRSVGFLYDLA